MKITDIQIDGFGVWTDLSVGELSEPMTVFYGPNEAGKTTLLQFVRTVLYGFSPERRQRYLPPLHGGRPGGALSVSTLNGQFRIQRTAQIGKNEDIGDVSIVAADGGLQGGHLLSSLLSNLDESIFNNVFAIGLRELQELATLNDTEAAQQLYKLSGGMDRVSLVDVMQQLDSSRGRIMPQDNRDGQLDKLLARRDKLRADLESAGNQSRRWGRLAADRATLEQDVVELQQAISELEQASRAVEIAMQVQDKWRRRQALDEQLKRLKPRQEIEDEVLKRLDRFNLVIREREKQAESLRQQRTRLREESASLPVQEVIWSQRARIEALAEHASWIETIREHVRKLTPEIERLQEELKRKCQELGIPPNAVANHTALVNERTLISLRAPARATRDDARKLKQAKAELQRARQQLEQLNATVELELAERQQENLPVALDRAGDTAAKLRRRLQIEERLEKLNRHRQELDEDCLELMESPIMPVRQMVTWAVIVSVGVMLMLIAVFSDMGGSQRIPLIWFGAMCTAGGFFLKHAYQQMNNQELEECQRQLAQVKKQIKEATTEREEIDATLPAGGGPLDLRLKKAEDELRRLESLSPLETDRTASQQRVEDMQKRVAQFAKALKESRARWVAALKKLNLSENLTPHKLKLMADSNEKLADLQRQLASRRKEKEEREEQMLVLAERVTQLLNECGLTPASDDPQSQLRQLNEALAEQSRLMQRRSGLKKQDRDLRRKCELCARSIEKLQLKRQALFSKAGVDDEPQLRRLSDQQHRYEEALCERATLHEQILTAVGIHCSEEAVEQELNAHNNLQHRWEQLMDQLRQRRADLTAAHQRRGELQQEMKSLSQDRAAGQIQLELGCVEQQIAQTKQRWRLLASTGLVLESIRRIYETERQPETLNEASKYLKRFSEGKYQRVWVPLGKSSLRVDDESGRSLGVELLSQGTREAVFLSLRLALVAAYARRGAVLPLVLDDVLVNLDVQRAEAAAQLLADFAQAGHQVMLFTCHQHIVELFRQLNIEARELPQHGDGSQRLVVARRAPAAPPATAAALPVLDNLPAAPDDQLDEEPTESEQAAEPLMELPVLSQDDEDAQRDAERLLDQMHAMADHALAELDESQEDESQEDESQEDESQEDESQEREADLVAAGSDNEADADENFEDRMVVELYESEQSAPDESSQDEEESEEALANEVDERFIDLPHNDEELVPLRRPLPTARRRRPHNRPPQTASATSTMWWERD